jgi:hypothetical protein
LFASLVLLQPKKPWKTGVICGYITNLKQFILETFDIYDLNPHNKECHTAEGKLKLFLRTAEICQLFNLAAENVTINSN